MEVFIVRPFGKKTAVKRDKSTGKIIDEQPIDFDLVEKELISPALSVMNMQGGTTGVIFEAGDIREDMFSLLLTADLVIADISIDNANVFYELGIRHALRDKKTVLIKCPGFDDIPFDIFGYRYVKYSKDNPSEALPALIAALQETNMADRVDSPVFNVLPLLEPQDTQKLLALPPDFIEEVRDAHKKKHLGRLSLLASEVEGFHWKTPALRLIGEKLFSLRAFETARITWEKIRKQYPDDPEANLKLATIYQRLAEKIPDTAPGNAEALMDKSDQAIEMLMKSEAFEEREIRAETWSLKGRNEKTRWIQSWKNYPDQERAVRALKSGYLLSACENYKKAYNEDLNHFYSGINTLGLLTVIIQLAKAHPAAWELQFDSEEDASRELDDFIEMHEEISVTVKSAVNAEKRRLKEAGKTDPWMQITEADLVFLTCKDPARVEVCYQKALAAFSGNEFSTDATVRQLKLYEQLGVLPDNVTAAMAVMPAINAPVKEGPVHYLLFTGHMIDKAGRTTPRFPEDKEPEVRLKIKEEIQKIKSLVGADIIGIAGGACGGDTIFHEICQELDIRSEMYLALSRDMFIVESVQFAGHEWVDRFNRLYLKLPVHVLAESKELPKWLHKKMNYTIWERNNLWELNSALVNGGINMTLLALWDEKGGDGPGGTADMVKQSQARGAKTIIIPIH